MRNKHIIPRLIASLKEFRKLHGLTQEQFAKGLKVEQAQISKWETGESEVPSWVLKHLIEKWNVSSKWLLTGKGRPDEPVEEIQEFKSESMTPLDIKIRKLISTFTEQGKVGVREKRKLINEIQFLLKVDA